MSRLIRALANEQAEGGESAVQAALGVAGIAVLAWLILFL
jgi:hypothetical protein